MNWFLRRRLRSLSIVSAGLVGFCGLARCLSASDLEFVDAEFRFVTAETAREPECDTQVQRRVAASQENVLRSLGFGEEFIAEALKNRSTVNDPPSGDQRTAATAVSTPVTPPTPSAAPTIEPLSPEMIALRDRVRKALTVNYPRHQNTRDNTPWEVMHAIIAYGVDTQLFQGGPGGPTVNAVAWMCYNRPLQGDQIMFVNQGRLDARRGPGVQGHHGQFLAILAQSHVKSDYPMRVSGKDFTIADLIEHEKQTCVAGEELTFKLIAMMYYIDSDSTWTTRDGQQWSVQRLVKEELAQPIRGAACGGTHRLTGFSYAVNKRVQRGKPVVGEFKRAQVFLENYHKYTLSLQNPDGSFSTEWFTRRGDNPDIDRRLKTSGHILEWIVCSLSDQELRDPRITKAVDYVASLLLKHDGHKWEIGPLGHGLHALSIYDTRVFKPADAPRTDNVVELAPDDLLPLEARRADSATE